MYAFFIKNEFHKLDKLQIKPELPLKPNRLQNFAKKYLLNNKNGEIFKKKYCV